MPFTHCRCRSGAPTSAPVSDRLFRTARSEPGALAPRSSMNATTLQRRAERRIGSILCRKWRLESVINGSSSAVVYSAVTCDRRSRRAAIRVLHPELSTDETVRARFLTDSYASNQVDHPAAVPTMDHGLAEDGAAFVVMERVDGETLGERLARGPLSVALALSIGDQLLDVLACAHERGIVHRGLSPHHVMLTRTDQVRVLGFGGARLWEVSSGSGRQGCFPGVVGYAPPEQLCGRSRPNDPSADLYATGALLYHMLSGRPLHDAATPAERIARTLASSPRPLQEVAAHVPSEVLRVVDRAIRYTASERWSDARTMQAELRRAMGSAETSDGIPSPGKSPRRSTATLSPWVISTPVAEPSADASRSVPGRALSRVRLVLTLTAVWLCLGPAPGPLPGKPPLETLPTSRALEPAHDAPPSRPRFGWDAWGGPAEAPARLLCDVRSASSPAGGQRSFRDPRARRHARAEVLR